jgi:hypothetical protein
MVPFVYANIEVGSVAGEEEAMNNMGLVPSSVTKTDIKNKMMYQISNFLGIKQTK